MECIENKKRELIKFFKSDPRLFARGFCFDKIFLVFTVCSFIGVYYEQILNLITHYLRDGSVYWSSRRGVIYGPFSPIYGFGAVLICYFLVKNHRNKFLTFFKGFLFGGAFEYIISLLQEIFTGTVSWDYSRHFLNIDGRTTIPFMLFWGLLGLLFTTKFYPAFSDFIEKIPYKLGKLITHILMITLFLDMLVSFTAIFRQGLRREGVKPYTVIGELCDTYYTDEYLKKHYPNMKVKKR